MTDDKPVTDRLEKIENQSDLPPGRREPTVTEKLQQDLNRPRRVRLHDRLKPPDTIAWSPEDDPKLHRFIILREAGLKHDVDICRDNVTWSTVSSRADIGVFGRLVWTTGQFGDPHADLESDHLELVSLNRVSDWELLKDMAECDPEPDSDLVKSAEDTLRSLELI